MHPAPSPYPVKPPSHLLPHPTPLGCHRAPGLSSLCHRANFHWLSILHVVMYMLHVVMYMLLSQFVPSSPSSALCTSLFSISVSLLLPCKKVSSSDYASTIQPSFWKVLQRIRSNGKGQNPASLAGGGTCFSRPGFKQLEYPLPKTL